LTPKHFVSKFFQKAKLKIGVSMYFAIVIGTGNSEKRISITDFIIYLMNVTLCWRSKSQRAVKLSSSRAEYVVISET
jgi:hypothetical protein